MPSKILKTFIYTAQDKKNLQYFKDEIDEIMLNGNVYAHSSDVFKKNILETGMGKTLLDPMTYFLQARIKDQMSKNTELQQEKTGQEMKIKPSLIKLLKLLDINTASLEKVGSVYDLSSEEVTFLDHLQSEDEELFQKLIRGSLAVQNNLTSKESDTQSLLINEISKGFERNLIAPTFVMEDEATYNHNVSTLSMFDIFPIIITKKNNSADTLEFFKSFIKRIKSEDKEILLWLESKLPTADKKQYYEMIREIDVKTSLKFAGYDELIIAQDMKLNIRRVISAFGYGDNRNVFPVGGGMPSNKVYSTIKHDRLAFQEYYAEVKHFKKSFQYIDNYCACKTCKQLFRKVNDINAIFAFAEYDPYSRKTKNGIIKLARATSDAQLLSTRHFIWNRMREIDFYNKGYTLAANQVLWTKKD